MPKLVSLLNFLTTGHLGDLKPGLTMNEVATLLGPPESWLIDGRGSAPQYWIYNQRGGRLEVSFEFGPDPYCVWYQIEDAGALRGDADVIANDLVMTLDGLTGASRISDFVRAIPDIESVKIQFDDGAGYIRPQILIERGAKIGFRYKVWNEDPDFLLDSFREHILFIEENYKLEDIYSYTDASRWSQDKWKRVLEYDARFRHTELSGREYLDFLSSARGPLG